MIRGLRARILALAAIVGVGGGIASQLLVDQGNLHGTRLWFVAGVTLAAVTLSVGFVVASFARRTLRELAGEAQNVARDTNQRISRSAAPPDDEIRQLAEWLNFLAEDAQKSHDALLRERSLLSGVAEGLTQGVIAVDGRHRIELINDAARQMLGVASSPVGEPLDEFVRVPQVFELIDGDEAASAEVELAGKVKALIRVAHKYGGEGRVLLLEDVTTMRRLENVRRDFVANVSHELRTPVAVIRANAETLLAGAKDDPAFATRLIDGLHRNSERLARILTDLLDLSRLDAGQYRLEIATVPVRALAEQSLTAIEPQATKRNVTVALAIPDDIAVQADPKALDQILVNLIDNGVKYTRADGHVWVEARPVDDAVRIEVRDDGPGIAANHRARVFERFYRADTGRSREAGGTGLGLSIVKHLVESMDGEVGVEANSPTGSIFWLRLPRAPARGDLAARS